MKNSLKIKPFLLFLLLSFGFIGCEKENSEIVPSTPTSAANLQVLVAENDDKQRDFVTLVSKNGKYISSEDGRRPITCNRSIVGPWEIFELVDLGNRKYALKGSNGKYVSSENGSKPMTCNRDYVGPWETFFLGYPGGGGAFFSQFNDKWTGGNWLFISIENENNEDILISKKDDLRNEDGSVNQDILFIIDYL